MHLVVIDLVPALLSWEGRELAADPSIAGDAAGALEHMASHFALTGIADAGHTRERLHALLEREDLAGYFETIGSSAEFGPRVSPRVLRRFAAALKTTPRDLVFVTARPGLGGDIAAARIRTVVTSHAEFGTVDEEVEALIAGRVSP
jgi:hypothetical protein